MTPSGKTIEKDFSLFFTDPIVELNRLNIEEANTQKKKKQIVLDLAKRLEMEGEVPLDDICMIITKNLQGVLKDRTIREYLPDKYKSSYRSMNAKKQRPAQSEPVTMDNLAAVPPLNREEADDIDTLVIDSKNKISIDKEASIRPFSPVDISLIDTDLVRSSECRSSLKSDTPPPPQQQEEPKIVTSITKCPECIKKDMIIGNQDCKILQLTEIVEKSEKFVSADKLVDNKKIPFEFDISPEELRKKMHEIFNLLGDKVKVRFKGIVDISTGETILLFYGNPVS